MLIRNLNLDESHFISSFIGALNEEIRFGMKLFKPITLRFAVEQGRLQEKAIEAALKRTKMVTKLSLITGNSSIAKAPIATVVKPNSFWLSHESYEYRKSNHLCYKCGKKYTQGHQCKKKQLNSMIGTTEVPTEIGDNKGVNTILVRGTIGNRKLPVLIDSGSTHSFIDATTIKESGYQAQPCPPVRVTVADGNYVMCTSICMSYQWKMQGRPFQENLLIIPIGGCDMVMGNNWMKKHNPTKFDHEKMCVTIGKKGNKLVLQGITEEGKLTMITSGTMGKIVVKVEEQDPIGEAIEEVLQQYSDVFAKLKTLPPVRTLDHTIPLKPRAMPVSLRLYRYNYSQKEELERQGLNDITIKDKYPIPIVDDLLDELSGSVMFSKVDLRAGYHHIRMKVEDVYKTAFRTHMGHYEFKNLSEKEHVTHLSAVFDTLRKHSLFAKRSKCSFGQSKVEYLGHIITVEGVSTDPSKIKAMIEWPKPNCVRALRGFLGLTRYYRKYVANYGTICRPLTDLLRKEAFK
ncbi:uncharacterized protein [Nicotiana sylvestris]|uniref:Uncharacterized protein LOC104234262 n=1 Tax=Nicotiana sylvestris TaxID=4096 RepID=A0A1U7XGP0_NICSY|nr:PREDICTED: uncharacterized protein LOC104234262 [Nicotiana sylvestris]